MDFEQVFKSWKHEVERWLRRGLVGGRVDSRGLVLHSLPEQHESEALRPSGSTLTTKVRHECSEDYGALPVGVIAELLQGLHPDSGAFGGPVIS